MKFEGYKFALVHDGDVIAKEPNTNFGKFELIRQGRELLNKRLVQFQLEIHVLDTTNKFVKVIEDHRKGW